MSGLLTSASHMTGWLDAGWMHKINERSEWKQLLVRPALTPEQPAVIVYRDCILAQPQRGHGGSWSNFSSLLSAWSCDWQLAVIWLSLYFQWLLMSVCFLNVANVGVIFQTLLTHTFSHLWVDASFTLFSIPAHQPLSFLSDNGGEVCDLCILLRNSVLLNFF